MAKRVLVVDDEWPLRELVRGVLEEAGFEVITAADGQAGLFEVVARRPDLVVLDVVMPGMDGLTALQALRRRPDTQDLPVIMLTSLASDLDVLRGWLKGVDCYLTKPFDPAELAAMVGRLLDAEP
jgi:two-component system alkaline phosphatase synthesis response regulator PhoP